MTSRSDTRLIRHAGKEGTAGDPGEEMPAAASCWTQLVPADHAEPTASFSQTGEKIYSRESKNCTGSEECAGKK